MARSYVGIRRGLVGDQAASWQPVEAVGGQGITADKGILDPGLFEIAGQ
jgi:hypothetical protein